MYPCVRASQAETCLTSGGVQRPQGALEQLAVISTHTITTQSLLSPSIHPSPPLRPPSGHPESERQGFDTRCERNPSRSRRETVEEEGTGPPVCEGFRGEPWLWTQAQINVT
ncbi:hypothetical protein Q7C36_017050 [Tachysurus vachellii]|uniref:Uncharacterized protein n=1 Tax=Tachysurus vachellii TaxID=175792 RepID=A0AA88SCM2_TACVA|nr:hypothetical protein Q7C36_017050 [Tachysurus vachellii]